MPRVIDHPQQVRGTRNCLPTESGPQAGRGVHPGAGWKPAEKATLHLLSEAKLHRAMHAPPANTAAAACRCRRRSLSNSPPPRPRVL